MHGVDLIGTLAGGLTAALIFGYVTQRLGLALALTALKIAALVAFTLVVGNRVIRTAHLQDLKRLRAAGAQHVFSGEGEVALALSQAILDRLGATPEQFDRERDRVHRDLFN
jgi:predicted Kef-type K+ transport protein